MRKYLATLIVCLVCFHAQAQAHEADGDRGRFKLFLDAQMLSYNRQVAEYIVVDSSFVDSYSYKANDVLLGPFTGGGIGMGYAVLNYLVPQMYYSMQGNFEDSSTYEAGDQHTLRYLLAPQVEFVRPHGKLAPYATAGLGFSGNRTKLQGDAFGDGGELTVRTFAIGPTLSAGLHRFLVTRAALDFCFRFNSGFLVRANGNKVEKPADQRAFELMFVVGTSFWL
jgi:hypothetical protein